MEYIIVGKIDDGDLNDLTRQYLNRLRELYPQDTEGGLIRLYRWERGEGFDINCWPDDKTVSAKKLNTLLQQNAEEYFRVVNELEAEIKSSPAALDLVFDIIVRARNGDEFDIERYDLLKIHLPDVVSDIEQKIGEVEKVKFPERYERRFRDAWLWLIIFGDPIVRYNAKTGSLREDQLLRTYAELRAARLGGQGYVARWIENIPVENEAQLRFVESFVMQPDAITALFSKWDGHLGVSVLYRWGKIPGRWAGEDPTLLWVFFPYDGDGVEE